MKEDEEYGTKNKNGDVSLFPYFFMIQELLGVLIASIRNARVRLCLFDYCNLLKWYRLQINKPSFFKG